MSQRRQKHRIADRRPRGISGARLRADEFGILLESRCSSLSCAGWCWRPWSPTDAAAQPDSLDLHCHAAGRGDWARRLSSMPRPTLELWHRFFLRLIKTIIAPLLFGTLTRGRHCWTFQPEASGTAGTALHHLLRGRDHDRHLPRAGRDQPEQSRRRRPVAGRKHR